MSKKTKRCNECAGCAAEWCGECPFCLDNPRFGGPNVKRQTCVHRRCLALLQMRLSVERRSYRRPCGKCESCCDQTEEDCGVCLVCMDKLHFDNKFIPGALCHQKKCDKVVHVAFRKMDQQDTDSRMPFDQTAEISSRLKRRANDHKIFSKTLKKRKIDGATREREQDSQKLASYAKKLKLKSMKQVLQAVPVKKSLLESTFLAHNGLVKKAAATTSKMVAKDKNAESADRQSRDDAFMKSISKPATAIERAFWNVLNLDANAASSQTTQQEPQSDDDIVKRGVLKALAAKKETSSPHLIKLFTSLPAADFSALKNSTILPQFPKNREWFIEPLQVEPVHVKSVVKDQIDTEDIYDPSTLLGYVVSLDKQKVAERLSVENRKIPGGAPMTPPKSADPDNATLQMKLLQMHTTQQLHNYVMNK